MKRTRMAACAALASAFFIASLSAQTASPALAATGATVAATGVPVASTGTPAPDTGKRFKIAPEASDPGLKLIAPTDAAFVYEGRVDLRDPKVPVLIWEGSRVRTVFQGTKLVIDFDGGSVFFDVEIDGTSRILALKGGPRRYALQDALEPGDHSLVIFKRSEASVGSGRFMGIEIEADAKAVAPAADYSARLLFLGDSITAGACSEDGAKDQWTKMITHNSARSYATLVAKALNADFQNVSVSGMGMVTGWNTTMFAPQAWNSGAFGAAPDKIDTAAWTPDLVFINIGENDGSFSSAKGKPFPSDFDKVYIDYVKAIKAAWPGARVILLRGGMFNGARNKDLIKAWERVGKAFAKDKTVSSYAFKHWTQNHPRVADHQALAAELIEWMSKDAALRAFVKK